MPEPLKISISAALSLLLALTGTLFISKIKS